MFSHERKSLFIIFALIVVILAPIVVIFTPVILSVTLYQSVDTIVFIPLPSSMTMYALAFTLIVLSLITMYFIKKNMHKIGIYALALAGFILLFSLGTKNYVYINTSTIETSHWKDGKKVFTWDEIERISVKKNSNIHIQENEEMTFTFTDGYSLTITLGGVVDSVVEQTIIQNARQLNIPISNVINE